MLKRSHPDFFMFVIAFLLTGIGLIAVYSASYEIGYDKYNNANYFLFRQLNWAFLGFIALLITMNIPYNFFKKLSPLMFFGVVISLVLVYIPGIGIERNFAKRWIEIGNIQFQPIEFLKVAICLYFPYLLEKKLDVLDDFKQSLSQILTLLIVCAGLIVFQPDFSNAVMIIIMTLVIMYVAGVSYKNLAKIVLPAIPIVIGIALWKPYRVKRLMTFMDPWGADALDEAFQIINSLYAYGNGGITGVGFGASIQKLFYLPEPHTDFIFSIIAEELGLIGALSIIMLFVLFFWRGIRIAMRTDDVYAKIVAISITVMITFQAFSNIGISAGLLPVTGMTLPFISYGGTSLFVTLIATGIVLNISRYTEAK